MSDNLLPRPNKWARLRFYAAPYTALTLILVAIFLKTGVIPHKYMYYALMIPATLELLLITLLIINIATIVKNYRKLKEHDYSTLAACQKALEVISSPRMARLATLEPQLYYALYRSYRKPVRAGNKPVFYSRRDSYVFLIKVLILLCLIEVAAVTIMLPQRWLVWKVIHAVLGLWAVMFLWSDYRAMTLYGHRVSQEGINLRLGLRCDQNLRWEDIDTVRKVSQTAPGGMMGPGTPKDQPGNFYIGLGAASNLEITLKEPQKVQAMFNEVPAVSRLMLSLEDPEAFVDALRAFQPELCE